MTTRHDRSSHQRTLQGTLTYAGRGLHTGQGVGLWLKPGTPGSGIVFVRKDVAAGTGVIPARWDRVVDTTLCTVLGNEHGVTVSTVEHLMAAFRACHVDNAVVELDGPEVPILDGSAEPFVELICHTGTVVQNIERRFMVLNRAVSVSDGDRFAVLLPDTLARLTVEIEFTAPAIGYQRMSVAVDSHEFRQRVMRARTFGFVDEIDALRAQGFARGGSLRNAVLVDGARIVNEEGLRFQDEFASHKILDSAGDLALAGLPIIAHYHGYMPGHRLNLKLLRELFATRDAWSTVTSELLASTAARIDQHAAPAQERERHEPHTAKRRRRDRE
jgi:UDP-3-O-[3-hydroxymyristoyl] N-acetylglucosamine deacetylase